MSTTLTIQCPACATTFPVDPEKVPAGGARTECTVCHTPFRVDDPATDAVEQPFGESWEGPDALGEEDVPGDEVVAVWDAEAPDEESSVDGVIEAAEEDVWAETTSEASDMETEWSVEGLESDVDEEGGGEAVDLGEGAAGAHGDDLEETVDTWGDTVEEEMVVEADDAIESAREDVEDALDEMEGSVDDALSEFSESMDDAAHEEAGEDESVRGPADGIVTDQWSDLVPGETAAGSEGAETWAGDEVGDDDGWVLETEDGGMDLAGLDLDVDRLDTVEEQMREAREGTGLPEAAEDVDASFPAPDGTDFPGGEVVLPEDALEMDGGMADVGRDLLPETEGPAEDGPVGAESAVGDEDVPPAPAAEAAAAVEDDDSGEAAEGGEEVFQFGRRDPHDKARRLARVLVSDMITYNPERHEEALAKNRLQEDFEEEIDKSWAEYVEQVGPEIAESTEYWRDALNEILARGESLF